MQVRAIKTPIIKPHYDLFALLRDSIRSLEEKSVVVVTSKVVALCEGAVVKVKSGTDEEKQALVRREADVYLDKTHSQHDLYITIKHHLLAVNAGIDQSNVGDYYALLPKDPYKSAKEIWQFLRKEFGVKALGVLITDSKTQPLKRGITGTAVAHCGFQALSNKIGLPDLYGRKMHMTQVNVAESLAIAAVLEMGEVNEAQPLAIITAASQVKFQKRATTKTEIKNLCINIEDDVYGPMLSAVPWIKNNH